MHTYRHWLRMDAVLLFFQRSRNVRNVNPYLETPSKKKKSAALALFHEKFGKNHCAHGTIAK